MRRYIWLLIFFLFLPSISQAMSFKRFSCGFSKPLGDEILERKGALSKAVSSSLSLVLEDILGEDTFLELKDDVLLPILSSPEKYLTSYEIKEERRDPGGGYYVCLVCSFDRKLLYNALRDIGVLPEPGGLLRVKISFSGLPSYEEFECLRDRVVGLEGVESFQMKEVSQGSGAMVAEISIERERFVLLFRKVCEELGLSFIEDGGSFRVDFKKEL